MGFLSALSLRDLVAAGIHAFRDSDTFAVAATTALAALFVWYCYRVGREQQQRARARNPVATRPDALPDGSGPFSNSRLYRNLQEYAKRYSWSGMGRIHKAIRNNPAAAFRNTPSIQNPGVFFLQDLPTSPYFPREAQKHDVELLERNFQTILAEFEGLPYLNDNEYSHPHYNNPPPGWKVKATPTGEHITFDLVSRGLVVGRNCRHCPKTYRLLSGLRTCMATGNVFGNARFSVLRPGTTTEERYGPSNIRLRCHLGLKTPSNCELVVGGEPQCWAQGRCLLFDDSFLHTARHAGPVEEGPRVVFLVDLWHPNVAAAERQALDFIFAPGR
nr:aspartate beta-hydroxylase domain-containing protein 2 [Anolis sagrei ordinatus]